jgi:predicted ATP-grasp superfamily ATP-dependent carboligase
MNLITKTMSNISGKLNLMQLKAAIRKMNGANGPIDCIVIPIEANHLFRGEQGVYLDLIAFESKTKNEKIKDTHLVKQSLPKEVLEAMSDEEKKSQPIIGNLRVWGEYQESAPQSDMTVGDEKDDLPF